MTLTLVKSVSLGPGEGLGSSIKLGASLYTIINNCRSLNTKIELSYSEGKYLETPITVKIPDLGLRLTFENKFQQELVIIEALTFDKVVFLYKGVALNEIDDFPDRQSLETRPAELNSGDKDVVKNGASEVSNGKFELVAKESKIELLSPAGKLKTSRRCVNPTVQQIYNKIFGPTYPGSLIGDSYILSYPGIAFKFKIGLQKLLSKLLASSNSQALQELLRWPKTEDVACDSLSIFNGESWTKFYEGFSKYLLSEMKPTTGKLPVFEFSKFQPKLVKVSVNLPKSAITVTLTTRKTYCITLGKTTQQQVVEMLGPPDDYFNKFDSRLNIHNHLKRLDTSEIATNMIEKFHNYYLLGLDFLYELNPEDNRGATGVLRKVIIHNGGIVDSLDFMKWDRCNWEVIDGTLVANSWMYFDQIPRTLVDLSENHVVLLNRNETELFDDDLDIIASNEVPVPSKRPNLDEQQVHIWGQSQLYGGPHCVWEVTDVTKCISSITIY